MGFTPLISVGYLGKVCDFYDVSYEETAGQSKIQIKR